MRYNDTKNLMPDGIFTELLNKQVCCYKLTDKGKQILDENALCFLSIMYPTFKVVKTEFDIYPDEPFIYIGDPKWIGKIQSHHSEPHIIMSTTGEYDLTDRSQVVNLVYARHHKTPPKYIQDLIDQRLGWSDSDFWYNMKNIWLTGTIADKEILKNDLFLKIITSYTNPIGMATNYLQALDALGDEALKYIEINLLKFIKESRELIARPPKDAREVKSGKYTLMSQYYYQCDKNTPTAINNLLESPLDNDILRYLDFLMDLVWINRRM